MKLAKSKVSGHTGDFVFLIVPLRGTPQLFTLLFYLQKRRPVPWEQGAFLCSFQLVFAVVLVLGVVAVPVAAAASSFRAQVVGSAVSSIILQTIR